MYYNESSEHDTSSYYVSERTPHITSSLSVNSFFGKGSQVFSGIIGQVVCSILEVVDPKGDPISHRYYGIIS